MNLPNVEHIRCRCLNGLPRMMFTFDQLVARYDRAIEEGKRKINWYHRKLPEVKVPVQIERGFEIDTLIITYRRARAYRDWEVAHVQTLDLLPPNLSY